MNSNFLFYSGIGSAIYSVYAYMAYYTYAGDNLLSSKQAKKMIKENNNIKIIDVRTQTEWTLGHHKKAIHIPAGYISEKELKKNNIKKDDIIIVYCNTGQRARKASEKIKELGYENTYYIAGTYLSI
jgi:phage shock protein E